MHFFTLDTMRVGRHDRYTVAVSVLNTEKIMMVVIHSSHLAKGVVRACVCVVSRAVIAFWLFAVILAFLHGYHLMTQQKSFLRVVRRNASGCMVLAMFATCIKLGGILS